MTVAYSEKQLRKLQRDTFGYFMAEANPANGLVRDTTRPGSHCSIAAVGLGLAAYTVGAENGYVSRPDAVKRVLTTLRFFHDSPQGTEPDATGSTRASTITSCTWTAAGAHGPRSSRPSIPHS